MTETLPTEPYSWTMVIDYLAAVFAHPAVSGSVMVFIAISLGVLAVRSIFRIERT